ncbi:hypothetical protein [Chromobacterium sp. IIBBL 290-4]|uniref:hypothetical protein n=1 Tax=Chromobacterium sp. IIBBL 290-4 TaxID=2953890 RepID=UPI0020B8473A|nr:hypothetical protein [Chromobacterium sp. IIBBL 290-4]UTH73275.1 hypothetical protein NKT35_17300 [Chromobacterium sp. IIBBL 290-4]
MTALLSRKTLREFNLALPFLMSILAWAGYLPAWHLMLAGSWLFALYDLQVVEPGQLFLPARWRSAIGVLSGGAYLACWRWDSFLALALAAMLPWFLRDWSIAREARTQARTSH